MKLTLSESDSSSDNLSGSKILPLSTGEPPEPVRVSHFVERELFISRVSGTSFLLPLSSNGDVAFNLRTNYGTRIFVFMLTLHLFAKCLQVCYLDILNPCVLNVYFYADKKRVYVVFAICLF